MNTDFLKIKHYKALLTYGILTYKISNLMLEKLPLWLGIYQLFEPLPSSKQREKH